MTQKEIQNKKDKIWDAFDSAISDMRYNDLPDKEKIDLLEDALSRVSQLANELGIDSLEFLS